MMMRKRKEDGGNNNNCCIKNKLHWKSDVSRDKKSTKHRWITLIFFSRATKKVWKNYNEHTWKNSSNERFSFRILAKRVRFSWKTKQVYVSFKWINFGESYLGSKIMSQLLDIRVWWWWSDGLLQSENNMLVVMNGVRELF